MIRRNGRAGARDGLSAERIPEPDDTADVRTDPQRWYARVIRAHARRSASNGLLVDRGIVAYLTLLPPVRELADRMKSSNSLFFRAMSSRMGRGFREDEGAHALRVDRAAWCASVPGVATVVRHGGRLVPIKDAEIENISRVAAGLAPKGCAPNLSRSRPATRSAWSMVRSAASWVSQSSGAAGGACW